MRIAIPESSLMPGLAYPEQPPEDVKCQDGQPVVVVSGPLKGLRGKIYHRAPRVGHTDDAWYVDGLGDQLILDCMRQFVITELTEVLDLEDTKYVLHEALGRLNR